MVEINSNTSQKTVCLVSVAKFDEFSGGVDRVGCFLIRYLKLRGYRVLSYYWRTYTDNPDYSLIDASYRFPQDMLYNDEDCDYLVGLIKSNNISLIFDISFVERIHEICYIAKTKCGIKSILLYQGDPFAYTKNLVDKKDAMRFNHQPYLSRVINYLKTPFSYIGRYNSAKELHRHNILYSDCYVVLSQYYVKQILQLLHLNDHNKIYAIPNAVEPFSIKDKKKQIVYVGRMDWQKRIDRVLRIWKRASEALPDWNLVMVGDGPYCDVFKHYAKDINLDRYSFVGAQPAQPYIEESSVLCLTSSYEGFGLTLVEAQSCGCVPIAFNSYAAIKDIIDDKQNGVLVQPFSERVYAKELVRLCSDIEYQNKLSKNGMESAKRFSPEKIYIYWDSLFHIVMGRRDNT